MTGVSAKPKVEMFRTGQRLSTIIITACLEMTPLVAVSSILINFLSLFMPLAVMQVYDRLIPRQAVESLTLLVIVLAGLVTTEAIFRIARNHIVSWSSTALAWRTHREILKRVMAAPSRLLETESASRNLDRIQSLVTFAEWHGSPSRLVLADLPFVVLYIGLMVIVGRSLAAVPLLLFCVLGVAVHQRSVAVRKINTGRASEDMKTRDFLVEALNGLPTIKASAMENQMQRRFERLQETVAAHSFSSIKLAEETQAFTGLLSNLTQMITVTVGAAFVINGEMSVGALACCVMLAGRAVQPLLRCVAVWNELQSVMVGLEKAEPVLNLPRAQDLRLSDSDRGPLEIFFTNVSFGHRADGPKLIKDASFTAPRGSILAIMGRDGSGKSTIADLICGYLPEYEGEIRIGNFSPQTDNSLLKRRIAIVRPGVSMMRGTIIENIAMFRRGDDIELAIQAARLIGLDADVCKLPLGYQTVMSDGLSAELPSGLIQRIAIARAIARRPSLIILDEANGALDMKSDQMLINGLQKIKGFTTILLITNRPSFAAIADQILHLNGGRLEVVPKLPSVAPVAQTLQVSHE
jgi:ATP-binding cassette, subfamily C, bacterial LapB